MSDDAFVYVTYINSTPEKVWDALLEGELTRQYWGAHENVSDSDWKAGTTWRHLCLRPAFAERSRYSADGTA